MNIKQIAETVGGIIIFEGKSNDSEPTKAFASDLMSDVLTIDTSSLLLITGLNNIQTIRTAEMAEIRNILFVRNKKPSQAMVELAGKEGINIILSSKSMFAACGLLYNAGMKPVY